MSDFVQVTTTTDNRAAAAALARGAVQARLAAGAQVSGPVTSFFWHHGEFGEGEEWTVLFKTTADRYPDLEAHLTAHHPWQNPEITAVPLTGGSAPYLRWVRDTTTPSSTD
jgi:periplasmic divalent cation tolerance protein